MVRRAVKALAIVLPDELPVAVLDDGALESDLRVRKLVWRQIAFDLGLERLEAWRDRCDAHKNVSADALAMDGLEPKLRFVEPAVHLAGADQASVQIVGPLMIGADEPLRCALFCGANSRAAMPARIVERVDRPVAPPQDDDRIVANLHREIVARSRDLAVMAGKHPVPGEDRLEIETVEIGVGIKFPVEAHAGAPGLQFGQHGVCQVHRISLRVSSLYVRHESPRRHQHNTGWSRGFSPL